MSVLFNRLAQFLLTISVCLILMSIFASAVVPASVAAYGGAFAVGLAMLVVAAVIAAAGIWHEAELAMVQSLNN